MQLQRSTRPCLSILAVLCVSTCFASCSAVNLSPSVVFNVTAPSLCSPSGYSVFVEEDSEVYLLWSGSTCDGILNHVVSIDGNTGDVLWNVSFPSNVGEQTWVAGSSEGIVLVDGVFGLDAKTGRVVWDSHALCGIGNASILLPHAVGSVTFLSCVLDSGNTILAGLDTVSGAVVWKSPEFGTISQIFQYNTALVGFMYGAGRPPAIVGVDVLSGAVNWNVSYGWGLCMYFLASADGAVMCGEYEVDDDNSVYATGYWFGNDSQQWQETIGAPWIPTKVFEPDGVYCIEFSKITVVDLRTGQFKWTANFTGSWGCSSFFSDFGDAGVILAASQPPLAIACVDHDTGVVLWDFQPTDPGWFTQPALVSSGNTVVTQHWLQPQNTSVLYGLDAATGGVSWQLDLGVTAGGYADSQGIVGNGRVAVGNYRAFLLGFKLP
jgi:outer membrane protein assembly factor BamB